MPHCAACGDDHPVGNSLCPRTGDIMTQGPCGKRIDRYEVERWIGGGGMGAVYIARHAMLQHRVALKLLHPSIAQRGDILERFLREARATASLGNRHIVRVHDCAITPEGTAFIAMEKLEGESLQGLLDREKKVAPPRAIEIVIQILEGLGEAHAAGIVHRDMKPGNVFLTPPESAAAAEFVTILDFGISKMRTANVAALTQTGTVMGTPHYMAPEQIWNAKDIDHRADLYAVGVMLYEMLAGRLPFDANNTAELLVKACTTEPIPLRDLATALPPPLVQVVDTAMARDPAGRYPDAASFANALRAARDAMQRPSMAHATAYAQPPQAMAGGWQGTAPTAYANAPMSHPHAQPVWGGAPPVAALAAPAAPRRGGRAVWIVLAVLAVFGAICAASVAFYVAQEESPETQHADAGTGPSMVPLGAPQTTEQQNVTTPGNGTVVIHPGPGGITFRPVPGGGVQIIQNGADASATITPPDEE